MKLLFTALLLLQLPLAALSQDLIIKRDSVRIEAKVLEISPTEIRYKNADNLEGPTIILRQSEVHKIRYPNGKETVFDEPQRAATAKPTSTQAPTPGRVPARAPAPAPAAQAPAAAGSNMEMYHRGMMEAESYYKGNNALWWTAGSTFGFPPAGLVVGIAMGLTPPQVGNMVVSDYTLLDNPNFRAGYQKQAQKRKLGKAATGFGIGLGVLLLYVAALNQ